MKHLTFKRIVSLLIIVIVGVVLGIYFLGGLTPHVIDSDNIVFSDEGFYDFTSGQKNEDGSLKVHEFDNRKIIGETDEFYLLFDEATTIASIVKKTEYDPNNPPAMDAMKYVYQTADASATKNSAVINQIPAANLILKYAQKDNGKASSSDLDSYTGSVQYKNTLTDEVERHYKVKYLYDENNVIDGVQILYEIGNFSAGENYFPKSFKKADYKVYDDPAKQAEVNEYNKDTLEERFRGNTIFLYTVTKDSETGLYTMKAPEKGLTYSKEAALYLEANELAVLNTDINSGGPWEFLILDNTLLDSYGTHLNSETSPVTNNPFMGIQEFSTSLSRSHYTSRKADPKYFNKDYYKFAATGTMKLDLYSFLYQDHQEKWAGRDDKGNPASFPVYYEDGSPVMRGGFHARDAEGNYMYDEDGNPVRRFYDLDLVAEDNEIFNETSVTSLERFQVGLQIKLSKDGIESTVIGGSLKDSDFGKKDPNYNHNYILTGIQMFPRLTTNTSKTSEGMIIVPDGSGAIVEFNNNKSALGYKDLNKEIYGIDQAFITKRATENVQNIMLGMFGYLDFTNQKGILGIIEKGGAQSSLYAGTNLANTVYFTTSVRQKEEVTAGTGWTSSVFTKWAKNLSKSDLEYKFMFLDETELDYVTVAEKYRDYLVDRYDLVEKDNTDSNLVDINFLGAFERYSMFLGIKYMTPDSLTTFDQAKDIVDELLANGVNSMAVSYSSWTDKEFEYETTSNLKVSSTLGRAKGMKTLNDYLEEKGINFYPEIFVASSKGYDYSFGESKYTAKGVGNAIARHYPNDLSTQMPDRSKQPKYYLNPAFYNPISKNLIDSYKDLNISGAYLSDLGNTKVSHFEKDKEVYGIEAVLYQQDTLKLFNDSVKNVRLSAPFDYAFPYVTTAINIPMESSSYGIFDATIPFYQLVVSGLFDYTTEEINGTNDKSMNWYLVKALETGSNLHFTISAEDPKILLETDYTQYYKSYYANWKDNIISMNKAINDSGIHGGKLISHELVRTEEGNIVRDISIVTYSNGLKLIINSGNTDYDYSGSIVPKNGYVRLGGL